MINPEIRDQAYQFFIEEAPELLQAIETGLLTLRSDRSNAKVHEIMRAAHSLKGGAASVELDTIKVIAHRLEDIIKALYNEAFAIDDHFESLLLQAYDGLKDPLLDQLHNGRFDSEVALTNVLPIFDQLEALLGDHLSQGEQYIPTSADLGIDIVSSLFEIDVAQGIEQIEALLGDAPSLHLMETARTQLEVFQGFAEMLNLPGFGAIAQATLTALDRHPDAAPSILPFALADLKAARHCVLDEGDRNAGGTPSPELLAWGSDLVPTDILPSGDSLVDSLTDDFAEPFADPFSDSLDVFAQWQVEPVTPAVEDVPRPEPDHVSRWNGTNVRSLDDLFAMDGDSSVEEIIRAQQSQQSVLDDLFGETQEVAQANALPTDDWASAVSPDLETTAIESASLDDIFGSFNPSDLQDNFFGDALAADFSSIADETRRSDSNLTADSASPVSASLDDLFGESLETLLLGDHLAPNLEPEDGEFDDTNAFTDLVQSVAAEFEQLPTVEEPDLVQPALANLSPASVPSATTDGRSKQRQTRSTKSSLTSNLSVRVDFHRLERMNNLVGELAINRNSQSLQNEQLQASVKGLINRFQRFQAMTGQLRSLSDQMLIAPERQGVPDLAQAKDLSLLAAGFDSLEMDSYGSLHALLQTLLEEMMQLEESVDDIGLFARSSNQTLDQQRQMLTNLRDELMWARMLPLSEVLNRFPRVLRDLATTHHKPVKLQLQGAGVLVDKAALEKLYDPLLHLLRNAFDHGIEPTEIRQQRHKPEEGTIEIQAYHQGNQTLIEITDDGGGLNLEKIAQKAVNNGLMTPEQVAVASKEHLQDLIFEPGFSTASQVSDLSGRGVGLDVVRSQLRSLKGSVNVDSITGRGTTFTLRLPLTLTIAKLLICLVGHDSPGQQNAIAIPSDSIEEILMPQAGEIKQSGNLRFLSWQRQIIPIYPMTNLLSYGCSLSESLPSKALNTVPQPAEWGSPLLILRKGQQLYALEVDRLITEQELVIKPFGSVIASPNYCYGCTILGDGTLIPVINGATLIEQSINPSPTNSEQSVPPTPELAIAPASISTILVVDDSAALRRTLALTLQKAGYRVLQAKDGREALEQLQQSPGIQLVVCDVEMPNMNGFEFLGQRRRDPNWMKIPVAMLTSRSSDKHRQLALQLGANAYFTKPYIELQFLADLKELLTHHPVLVSP